MDNLWILGAIGVFAFIAFVFYCAFKEEKGIAKKGAIIAAVLGAGIWALITILADYIHIDFY